MQNHNDEISIQKEDMERPSYSRRSFLQISATLVASISLPLLLPQAGLPALQVDSPNKRIIRGTADGRILESIDNGKTWRVNADFGPECPVQEIRIDSHGLLAEIEHKGLKFILKSIDGRHWVG